MNKIFSPKVCYFWMSLSIVLACYCWYVALVAAHSHDIVNFVFNFVMLCVNAYAFICWSKVLRSIRISS